MGQFSWLKDCLFLGPQKSQGSHCPFGVFLILARSGVNSGLLCQLSLRADAWDHLKALYPPLFKCCELYSS